MARYSPDQLDGDSARLIMCRTASLLGASPLGGSSALLPKDRGESSERLVHRGTIWKDVQHLRIDHNDVGPLSMSGRGQTSDCVREVVLGSHGVALALPMVTS